MDYNELATMNDQYGYEGAFWNYVRGADAVTKLLSDKIGTDPGSYPMPAPAEDKFDKAIKRLGVFRRLATVVNTYGGRSVIFAVQPEDTVQFVPEDGAVEFKELGDDARTIPIASNKLVVALKLSREFICDAAFDLEGYIVNRMAKAYACAEDNAFINGSGTDEPEGVLRGAETSHTAPELTFDDIIRLYFSVKPEYRERGVWLVNDETGYTLRTLKDDAGNYLWNQANDTILGKPVVFSRFMPSAEQGSKPVAFGDFSYYWIVKRSPVMVKVFSELFATRGMTGYYSFEFIDGKLIRPEAVKTLLIGSGE